MKKKLILCGFVTLLATTLIFTYFKVAANQATTETANPITSRAILTIGNQTKTLTAIANEYVRINVSASQVIQVQLDALYFLKNQPVVIEANNGGNLNGRMEPRQILPTGSPLSFTFTSGTHPGLYTVKVKQGNRRELFEFWVGPERPVGEGGPDRIFVSPEERK